MDNDNYMVIQGWMRKVLGLKGNELLVFALIYGFSQDGDSEFYGSWSYIAEWTGASKQTINNTLKSLCDKGLIQKRVTSKNGIRFCSYKVSPNLTGGQKILSGVVKKLDRGGQKTEPNNIRDNTTDINNTPLTPQRGKRFIPPTVDEVKAYCLERQNGIDAQTFVDFYESKGWMIGKSKMKDWKAAVRTWERNRKGSQQSTGNPYIDMLKEGRF